MARILVAGPLHGLAPRALTARVHDRIRSDGHDAVLVGDDNEDPRTLVQGADALVALLDGAPLDAHAIAAAATAAALGKPCLILRGPGSAAPPPLPGSTLHEAQDEEGLLAALEGFYDAVRPFAGRLVRDLVPRLVKEAGHELTFRELGDEERPRFLKQKVAEEAKGLAGADAAEEKEQIADVLEALEAFIQARGYAREDLKRVKEAKRRRRGGFEKCYVVEATAEPAHPEAAKDAPPAPTAAPPGAEPPPAWGPVHRAVWHQGEKAPEAAAGPGDGPAAEEPPEPDTQGPQTQAREP